MRWSCSGNGVRILLPSCAPARCYRVYGHRFLLDAPGIVAVAAPLHVSRFPTGPPRNATVRRKPTPESTSRGLRVRAMGPRSLTATTNRAVGEAGGETSSGPSRSLGSCRSLTSSSTPVRTRTSVGGRTTGGRDREIYFTRASYRRREVPSLQVDPRTVLLQL